MMRNTILLISIFCLCSCGRKQTEPTLINLGYIDTLYLDSFIDSFSVIPLELTENSIIDNVSKVIMHDDFFIIVDNSRTNKAISFFDSSGRYIRRISHFGRGPGEYLSITALEIDPSNLNLYVYDNYSMSVYIYDSLGVFLEKIDVSGVIASDFKILDDNTFAFYSPDEFSDFQNKTYPKGLLILDHKVNLFKSLLEYSKDTEILRVFNSGWFTQGDGFIGLLSSIENRYYKVTNENAVLEYSFKLPGKYIGVSENSKEPAYKAFPIESTKYLFFYIFFKDGRQYFPVLINKEDGIGNVYSWVKGFFEGSATIFHGASPERLISVILPQTLTPKEVSTLEKDFSISIFDNDNPLLVIYHLNR